MKKENRGKKRREDNAMTCVRKIWKDGGVNNEKKSSSSTGK